MSINMLMLIIVCCIILIMFSVIFMSPRIVAAFPVGHRGQSTQKMISFFILFCTTALLGVVVFKSSYDSTHHKASSVDHKLSSRIVPLAKTAFISATAATFNVHASAVVPAFFMGNLSAQNAQNSSRYC